MRRAHLALAACGLAAACAQDQVDRVALPDPPGGARTAFLARSPSTLWMLDLTAPPESLPAIPLDDTVELTIAYYLGAPADFRVSAGEVPPTVAGQGYVLPATPFLWSMRLDPDDAVPEWSALSALPPPLAGRRIAPSARNCPRYMVDARTLPKEPRAVVALDDGVLIADRNGNFWRVTRDAIVALPALNGRPYFAAAIAPDGELWTFGEGGLAAHGPVDGSTVATSRAPHGETIMRVLLDERGPGVAFITLSMQGTVARIDAAGWQVWDAPQQEPDPVARSIAWVEPGELLVVTRLSNAVRRVSATGVVLELPDADVSSGYSLAAHIEGFGPLIARMVDGQLLHSPRPGEWRELPGVTLGRSAYSLAQVGDQIYVGGSRGAMLDLRVSTVVSSCTLEPLVSGTIEAIIAPDERTLILVTSREGSATPGVAWLDPL